MYDKTIEGLTNLIVEENNLSFDPRRSLRENLTGMLRAPDLPLERLMWPGKPFGFYNFGVAMQV